MGLKLVAQHLQLAGPTAAAFLQSHCLIWSWSLEHTCQCYCLVCYCLICVLPPELPFS